MNTKSNIARCSGCVVVGCVIGAALASLLCHQRISSERILAAEANLHNSFAVLKLMQEQQPDEAVRFLVQELEGALARNASLGNRFKGPYVKSGIVDMAVLLLRQLEPDQNGENQNGH